MRETFDFVSRYDRDACTPRLQLSSAQDDGEKQKRASYG
jgi:hypothetical protein